jgi:hypothetical protein
MPWAAAAIGGSALIGGITSMLGSSKAASAAKDAANQAQQRYIQTRSDLQPYNTAGQAALPTMNALAMDRTGGGPDYVSRADAMMPGQMTQAELEATPGYKFTLDQGIKAATGSAAARGLGVSSGGALKAITGYATGLANSTYKDQFNIAQQRFSDVLGLNTAQQGNVTNQFARASNIASLGENAGAQTGSIGSSLAGTSASMINQAGIDTAAGIKGIGNAATGAAQNYLDYTNFQKYLNSPRAAGGGAGDTPLGAYPNSGSV